ncbi:MAG: M28 family peptidase [Terriglobales bacterium]
MTRPAESRRDSRLRLSRLAKPVRQFLFPLLASLSALTACAQSPKQPVTSRDTPVAAVAAADPGPAPTFNSTRAMQYVKEIVAFGPRFVGSANHKKVEDYILAHLKGDTVESDSFTADTPEGKFPVHNIIAKFPGAKDGIILLASHYDTNYPLRNTSYIGANDGASSSALLLEIANQLRGKKREGYSVWLIWDDAEESIKPDTELPFLSDSLYGIRHLADKWQSDGTLKKIKAFILADMIGDADLNIERPQNSTSWLEDLIYQAATNLGYQSHFFARTEVVSDDHVPFLERGVPSADVIDFDYGYNNVFWHTTQDTVDKLSSKSLEIVGSVFLETLTLLYQH